MTAKPTRPKPTEDIRLELLGDMIDDALVDPARYAAFAQWLDEQLEALEEQFADFATEDSGPRTRR